MEDNVKCEQCGSVFNRMFLLGKQGNAETCPVCGGKLVGNSDNGEEHSDWITWWYLKDKRFNDDYSLWDNNNFERKKVGFK